MKYRLSNKNILTQREIPSPSEINNLYPTTDRISELVHNSRQEIIDILSGKTNKIFIVIGPCSIHDNLAAIDYAEKLKQLSDKVSDKIFIIMRVYFEKPRTSIGWKGLINDPDLNGTFDISSGLKKARNLMLKISSLGLPIASEALDPVIPQYIDDLLSWTAIGARTVESQTHRQMASGISSPVGLKNATNGDIKVVINALKAVSESHHFIGISKNSKACIFETAGNPNSHIVLRGGSLGANYKKEDIEKTEKMLIDNKLESNIMVDCSHANSEKNYKNQAGVLNDCLDQIKLGNKSIKGFMIESNLKEGRQDLDSENIENLEYGVSITDSCISWKETEKLILNAHKVLGEIC